MPCSYRSSSSISQAFDELQRELLALDRAWTCEPERAGLRHAAADIRHHVCAALAALDALATLAARDELAAHRDGPPPAPPPFARLDPATRILTHEAFLAVLALGQLIRHDGEDALAPPSALAAASLAVDGVLDELAPLVSGADRALRRVLLDDEPLEAALAGIAHGR